MIKGDWLDQPARKTTKGTTMKILVSDALGEIGISKFRDHGFEVDVNTALAIASI